MVKILIIFIDLLGAQIIVRNDHRCKPFPGQLHTPQLFACTVNKMRFLRINAAGNLEHSTVAGQLLAYLLKFPQLLHGS